MKTCDHCNKREAKINTGISRHPEKTILRLRCLKCFYVEQQISETQDWRDVHLKNYAVENDLVKRPEETKTNLNNRCKIYLAKRGFIFHD